jgi:hypothetical protein
MHSEYDNLERTEALVAKQLRKLPLRRAPASLEARVMAAIASGELQPVPVRAAGAQRDAGSQRDVAPWYRSNFRRWPLPVQIVFALVSVTLAHWLMQQLGAVITVEPARLAGEELRSSWSVAQTVLTVGASLADSLSALLRTMPANWLVFVASGAATSYALLAGAGALVFRSINRPNRQAQ